MSEADNRRDWLKWIPVIVICTVQVILLFLVPRSNFLLTYGSLLVLFALYSYLVLSPVKFSFTFCIGLGILLRIIAVFSIAELSDDYYRFIWDGEMIARHVNPFSYIPQDYLASHQGDNYLQFLYAHMNSAEYHTVYPPILQYIFAISAWLFPKSIYASMVTMKLFILVSECITMRLMYLYATKKRVHPRQILWYALNPMIIVELTGNCHFEALMMCFLLSAFYLLETNRLIASAVCWALAIGTKMLPLMLAPLLLRYIGARSSVKYGLIATTVLILIFMPFYNSHLFADINSSLKLFYHLFEFNGSVFYFIRWIGYRLAGYDVIEETASILGIVSFVVIMLISYLPRGKFSLPDKTLWIFLAYFLFATMVHPWYIAGMILLSVFSKYKFPLVFSLLIMLSYFPYSLAVYQESNWIILAEYGLLFAFILWEYRIKNRSINAVI